MRNNYFCKIAFLFSFLMTLSVVMHAQVSRDVVYLKNGSVIKGTIVEIVPGSTIKIKTSDGSIFIYPMEEVIRTENEESSERPRRRDNERRSEPPAEREPSAYDHTGYFMMFRVGPRVNNLLYNSLDLNAGFINGIQMNEVVSLGVGIETTQYYFSSDQATSIRMTPVFLDARFYVPKRKVRPMFSFQFGYAMGGKTQLSTHQNNNWIDFYPATQKGGIFMAIGAGMRIYANKTFSFLWDGGVSLQSFDGYSDSSLTEVRTRTVPSLRLNLGLGINIGGGGSVKK
ncbi:MAG TPA: hypothetical protein VIM65_24365 [Cyclobacteriaceae bacterium]